MRAVLRIMIVAVAGIGLAAAAPVPDETLAQARETARTLMVQTKQLLEAQLKESGPVAAIGSCSQVAVQMAAQHEQDGWRVRRVSLRARNAADRPDAWERRQLKAFAKQHAAKPLDPAFETYEVVREAGVARLRYLRPIVLPAEPCLKCHGTGADIPADVAAELRRRYPKDTATGYRAGDLRGAVSVSIPLPPR